MITLMFCQYIHYYKLVGQNQNRTATMFLYLPRGETRVKKTITRIPIPKRDQLLECTSHAIISNGNRYSYTKCHSSFHVSDSAFKPWLQTQCIPINLPTVDDRPKPIEDADVLHIGNRITHISLQIYAYRGLIYCNECEASAGTKQIRKFAIACAPSATGQIVIDRINVGKRPIGVTVWLDEL